MGSGLWCNSSIFACEANGPGANPGFLTNFDGPKLIVYPPHKGGCTGFGESWTVRVRFPAQECLRSITPLAHLNSPTVMQFIDWQNSSDCCMPLHAAQDRPV